MTHCSVHSVTSPKQDNNHNGVLSLSLRIAEKKGKGQLNKLLKTAVWGQRDKAGPRVEGCLYMVLVQKGTSDNGPTMCCAEEGMGQW